MAQPNRDITIHRSFFDNCRHGIKVAMQEIAKKENLNANDIQALRILGDVYEAMISPAPENCTRILEDCNKNDLSVEEKRNLSRG